MQSARRSRSNREGFTLIEMLVVLAILVLLMSMVGPRIMKSREKARNGSAMSQIGMLQGSLESYVLDMNEYPSTEVGLQALIEASSEEETTTKWDGPYLSKSKLPKDPWGRDYQYEFPPTHGKDESVPDIWSLGYDGEDNTEDDVVSWTKEEDEEEEIE